ncbi:MAG: hypothetical protein PVH39_05570 [Syntrophobacterales bacterium]
MANYMAVLPGVLGCRFLRRTVRYASDQHPAVAMWDVHLRSLATAIHETSRLGETFHLNLDEI